MRQVWKRRASGSVGSRSARVFVLVIALSLVAAACGGDEEEPGGGDTGATGVTETTGEETGATGGEPEVSTINLGLLPLADIAPVHIAIAEGFFEEEGLTVEIQIVEGGAAAIPALVSGDLDITFGNYVSFFLASSEGLDLRIIAEQNRATPGFSSVMTLPDSGIESPTDLEGTRVAVNTLANVAEITTRAQIADAGGDPDAAEYVEIPFPDMIAALEQGDVDAIFAVEPFVTIAADSLGAVEVVNPYGGRLEGFPVAGFQATTEFAEANPNTIAAFQRAMVRASELAAGDQQAVVDILPTYTELDAELAASLTQPVYVSEIDVEALAVVPDLMVEFGLIDEAPDVSGLIVPTS